MVLPLVLLVLLTGGPAHAAGITPSGTNITNQAVTNYTDVNGNNYTAQSNSVTVTVSSVFTVSVTCAGDDTGSISATVYYACTLTNTGNIKNTFALSAASTPNWATSLIVDTNNSGTHEAGENTTTNSATDINQDGTYKFFIAVTIANTATAGATAATTLTVVGAAAGTGDDTSVARTTTAQAPALTVAKKVRNVTTSGAFAASGVTAKPAEILEYQVQVTNNGNLQAKTVVLQDALDANVTYVANSLWAGSADTGSAAPNLHRSDDTTGDATPCGADSCAIGSYNAGANKVFFFMGTGANETTGGSLNISSSVYVYYRVVVK